ncbi:hypothetical protein [Cupriavidus necator]|uniref:hypothetical protein n=1 Tax=Cupriavidus necator TaxID=106590 RepID=UPI0005B39324|nr:hypothetical protein [Cupriavidus necator]
MAFALERLAEFRTGLRQHISTPLKHGGFLKQVSRIHLQQVCVGARATQLQFRSQRRRFVA